MRRIAPILALTGLLTGCGWLTPIRVHVHNNSPAALSDVVVRIADKVAARDSLPTGDSFNVTEAPSTDGSIFVTFTREGVRQTANFDYVTPGMPLSCDVVITSHRVTHQCHT